MPARETQVDAARALLGHVGPGGLRRLAQPGGALDIAPLTGRGPSLGWLDTAADSLAVDAMTDPQGRLLRSRAAASPWAVVAYEGSDAGVERREAPRDAALARQAGPIVLLPPARVRRGPLTLDVPALQVVSTATTPVAVTGEAQTLRYASETPLAYQMVAGATVTRASDGVVLTAGVHYDLDAERGILQGLVNMADVGVTLAYAGHPLRADLVSIHPITRALAVTAGAERPRVASMFEGAPPAGHVALYRILRSMMGADAQALHLYRGGLVRIGREPEIEAEIARNRRLARPIRELVRRRAAAVQPVRWGGDGDSITAMGAGTPAQLNTVVNGVRDRIGYFSLWDAAARALIPATDLGDGLGASHVEQGWNHVALRHLAATCGATWSYRNWGIGGTFSANTVNSGGFYNMGHPTRLAARVADACDVMAFATGMNELGEDFTYGNVRAICEAYLGGGALVLVVAPVRPNERFRTRVAMWRWTCAQLAQVARDLRLPFVDTARLFDPASLHGLALAEAELAEATIQNHPGVRELAAVGSLIAELL